jgi:hypothetical protein
VSKSVIRCLCWNSRVDSRTWSPNYQIISVSWVFIYAELLCRAIRHDLILLIILLLLFLYCVVGCWNIILVVVFLYLIFYTIGYLYCKGLLVVTFFKKLVLFIVPCVSGFIEFYYLFLFPDFNGVNDLC